MFRYSGVLAVLAKVVAFGMLANCFFFAIRTVEKQLPISVNARGRCLDYYLLPSSERSNFPVMLYGRDPPCATKYRITDLDCLALLRV